MTLKHTLESFSLEKNDVKHQYIGELDGQNRFSGHGKMKWKDESYYEGGWEEGKQHGTGTMAFQEDDARRSYSGDWKDNEANGVGVLNWKNGDKCEGEWDRGIMSGQGTFHWADGRTFEGQFFEGLRNGFGHFKFADDNPWNLNSFEGKWENGTITGSVIVSWKDGRKEVKPANAFKEIKYAGFFPLLASSTGFFYLIYQ